MATDAAAFQRTEFATRDPGEARELLARTYGARLQLGAIDERDPVVITTVTAGGVSVNRARSTDRYQPGDVYLANYPGADAVSSYSHGSRTRTVILPASLLAEVGGGPPVPVRFLSFSPARPGDQRWSDAARFVGRLLADPGAATAPLVIGPAARLLAATALSVFPSTLVTGPAGEEHHDARPETVRRSVSFIEANAGHDITVADIAAAACVTARAVQLAFRRHLDTTPLAYLRRVRLELAHEDLRQAAAGGPVSVTAVAFRWGFGSASRFADQYRAAYGELPSATLHS